MITRYNRSPKYALAAHQLGQAIKAGYDTARASVARRCQSHRGRGCGRRESGGVRRAGRRAGLVIGALLAAAAAGGLLEPELVRSPRRREREPPGADCPEFAAQRARQSAVLRRARQALPRAAERATVIARAASRRGTAVTSTGSRPRAARRYNMNAMTAAHTTLPMPTWVEVTNLANGKRVVVKVNDRGPFVDNRLIDLVVRRGAGARHGAQRHRARRSARARRGASRRTAGQRAAGHDDCERAAAARAAGAHGADRGARGRVRLRSRMFVQVGAFGDRANATRLVERLRVERLRERVRRDGRRRPARASSRAARAAARRARVRPGELRGCARSASASRSSSLRADVVRRPTS